MTEHISKKADAPAGDTPAGEKKEKQPPKQGDRRDKHNGRHGGKNRKGDRPEQKERVRVEEAKPAQAEQPAQPAKDNKGEGKPQEVVAKRKHDRRDRHGDKKQDRKDRKPEAVPQVKVEEAKPAKEKQKAKNAPAPRAPRAERVVLERATPLASSKEEFSDEQLRADGLLFTLDDVAAPAEVAPVPVEAPAGPKETIEVVGIRFRGAGKTYYFSPAGISFADGDYAIVETVRGVEYGEVLMGNRLVSADEVVQPLKPVLRKATEEDAAHNRSNRQLEEAAKPVFFEKVKKNKLEMQLVDVEYTFDNTKLCFYFTAEGRVDFRELVKDLASVFRTRIELRQIGVRDEARMFGGLGVCGRPFCCKSFLADFVQVSIKMAKEQNLSLASAKISGSCGRLMCCLRYEQDTYERENAEMPRVNSTVDTPKGKATVLESNFLTKKIKVLTAEDNAIRFFAPEEVQFLAPPPKKNAKEVEPIDPELAKLEQ
ncbi:MAG: hypothetical protein IKT91_01800 [Clostridia bacterium]|nr:hypothetical protein [Clostridia bacterium]